MGGRCEACSMRERQGLFHESQQSPSFLSVVLVFKAFFLFQAHCQITAPAPQVSLLLRWQVFLPKQVVAA